MDLIEIFQDMASTGQPPLQGCVDLGVGYEDAFQRLEHTYMSGFFKRGKSAEKFVVGPYGSGKTHFLRQTLEIARKNNCASAEVQLSRNIDIAKILIVYKEVAREIAVPGQKRKGIEGLLKAYYDNVLLQDNDPEISDEFVRSAIAALEDVAFEHDEFRRVLIRTLKAIVRGEKDIIDAGCQWLSGEVADKDVAKVLKISTITATEQDAFGRRAMFSLCQFIKAAGYNGTVIGFDEAEQAANVPAKQLNKILSMARSEIDAITRLQGGAVLIFYAFTPDVIQEMQRYPALQQRLAEPDPNRRFFDGNDYSPQIDLAQPFQVNNSKSLIILQRIGERLVNLIFETYQVEMQAFDKNQILKASHDWADEIDARNASISNRRDMVRLTCSRLLHMYHTGSLEEFAEPPDLSHAGDEEV